MVQLRHLVILQEELPVSYSRLAVVSVDPPEVNGALRIGLGATFPFLSDREFKAIEALDIVDTTDKRHGTLAIPYAFSLLPDLSVHRIYNGWYYVGRPTNEELRADMRAMTQQCRADYDPQA